MHVCLCQYMLHIWGYPRRPEECVRYPGSVLESCLTLVPGIEPWSCGRAARAKLFSNPRLLKITTQNSLAEMTVVQRNRDSQGDKATSSAGHLSGKA